MSHLHILVVFMSALLVGLATSTRCQPTSLAELKAMPFWQTFYDRLGVVVWGQPVGSFMFDLVGFNIDTTFDDGDGARACSIETVSFQTIGEPICYVTTTYSKESAIPPSGPLTIDYPTGFSTVVAGTVTKVAAPVTDGKVYDRSFIVQDATPIVNSTAGLTRQYQANGLYSDTLGNSFEVDVNREYGTNVTLWGAPGTICSVHYHNTTCIQEATGQAPFRLEGGVRVGFNSKVNGHYYWYLWFDQWIPGNQAWSYSQFRATITTSGSDDPTPLWDCK